MHGASPVRAWTWPAVAGACWVVGTLALWVHPPAQTAGPPWLATGLLALSAAALLRAATADDATGPLPTPDATEHDDARSPTAIWRWAVLAASLLWTVGVLLLIPQLERNDPRGIVFLVWLCAIVAAVVALGVGRPIATAHGPTIPAPDRRTIAVVVGITVVAAVLRLPALGSVPFTLAGDEASQGIEGIRTLTGEITDPFSTGWLGVPTMSFFLNGWSIDVVGPTIAGIRLPWAVVGIATIPTTFWLTRRAGTTVALVCTALVATYHVHIHFSRLGSNQIADPLFVVLALVLALRGLERGRALDWVGSGCVMGLAMYFYAGARLTPLVVAAVLAHRLVVERRSLARHLPGIAAMAVGAVVVAAPMIQYAFRFPDDFNARLEDIGVFQSGWLANEVDIRGESALSILGDQFIRSVFGMIHYPDRTVWYGLPGPFLSPVVGGLSVIGLAMCTWRSFRPTARPVVVAMTAWWWLGIVTAGVLTAPTPSSQRLVTITVPTCFMIAVAIDELVRRLPVPRWRRPLLGAAVVLFAVTSVHTYVEHMSRRVYGGVHAEIATSIAPDLQQRADTHEVVVVGAPAMYWNFPTFRYLAPDATGRDVVDPIADPDDVRRLVVDGGADRERLYVVVIDGRLGEADVIEAALPGGTRGEVRSGADGRLLAVTYDVAVPG